MFVYNETNSNNLCLQQEKSSKSPESTLLDDIIGISVENEIISDLLEPIKITFRHSALPVSLFEHFHVCIFYILFVILYCTVLYG